jgi:hypothetical protein
MLLLSKLRVIIVGVVVAGVARASVGGNGTVGSLAGGVGVGVMFVLLRLLLVLLRYPMVLLVLAGSNGVAVGIA